MPFPLLLLFATLALPQAAQAAPSAAPAKDALALLNEVSQRYTDAKSYHLEAIEEKTESNELSRRWDKRLLTAIVEPDGRYRYEGDSGFGSATLVSDGSTHWDYHPVDHLYTAQPASPNNPDTGQILTAEEVTASNAKSLMNQLAHQADRVKSAAFLPDETITVNGKSVDCYLVHYVNDSLQRGDIRFEWTVWIDKSRKVIVKTFSRGETYVLTMARGHIPRHTETTVTYSVVELGQPEPASLFSFVAPADAKLVPEFPNDFAKKPESAAAVDLVGKPAPELQLAASDGKVTPLSSFHGKPVFVEFWATWCGPCVDLMPGLTKLYAETADRGLIWVSIDSDDDASAVAAFMSREHVAWPNYHDQNGLFGKAFHRNGIPLGVLVDADGKVTFYKTGYGIADLRAAIAKLGPEFSSVAPVEVNSVRGNSAGANSK
jgi:thiol-disulfide isomerase/thioredoxin